MSTPPLLLEVVVGNGWYRGRLGRPSRRDLYGDRLGVVARLDVRLADGTALTVSTDRTWSLRDSQVIREDLYDGCETDLTASSHACARPVEVLPFDRSVLVERDFPPVRVTERRKAVTARTRPDGSLLLDFGQNLVGWVSLGIDRPRAGQTVVVRHAEVERDGDLQVRPLRGARATDVYRLAEAPTVTLEPSFTFHGFRYAVVEGLTDEQLADAEAVVVGSDLRRTGWLHTSDPLLNRFHENVVWSMRGNMVSLPTDPQRDERLGWTADIQVFAPTAAFLYDVDALLRSWLEDLYSCQGADGSVPVVVPDIYRRASVATAGWATR
ncbi:hypothetical protein GCM10010261_20810 [Streptomyces pilosus]|nr:family 78 glycoside hydrolase catalytic domain [Streptomyces pilosus]GGV46054.1 hypothetical protein GCM10010261_20810 [Streptomyces pilosus]